MSIHTGHLRFSTEGDGDVVDLTEGVESVVEQAGVETGVASVFVPGSTAAVDPGTNTDTVPVSTPDESTTLWTPAVMSIASPSPSVEKRSSPVWTSATVRARSRP